MREKIIFLRDGHAAADPNGVIPHLVPTMEPVNDNGDTV